MANKKIDKQIERYKEKESVYKKGFWAAIFLSALALVMAIICVCYGRIIPVNTIY